MPTAAPDGERRPATDTAWNRQDDAAQQLPSPALQLFAMVRGARQWYGPPPAPDGDAAAPPAEDDQHLGGKPGADHTMMSGRKATCGVALKPARNGSAA
jgi:hypothetical protein